MPIKNPELLPLFTDVKKLLEPYASQFPPRKDEPGGYELWSDKPAEALLKGKSCFYVKKLTPQIAEQITAALDEGVRLYRERGWV